MLILPKPAKNEFALGFIGRLCHLNSARSHFELMRSLVVHYGLRSEQGAYLHALSLIAGTGLQDFVSTHTIAPAMLINWNAFAGRLNGKGHGRIGDDRNPLKLARNRAYFCPRCLEQQCHAIGFPFWHRAHQLPGVYWCPWHRTALLACSDLAMQKTVPSPSFAEPECVPVAETDFLNPVLEHFTNIMMGLLAHPGSHSKDTLTISLRIRAVELGLNVGEQSNSGRRLSDLAGATCPAWWLEDTFGWRRNMEGGYFKPIDDVLFAEPTSARAYVLAIALLFDPDEWQSLRIENWKMDCLQHCINT